MSDASDVLSSDPTRSALLDDAQEFWPQVDGRRSASGSGAVRLAREAADDEIREAGARVEIMDVPDHRDSRPVLAQYDGTVSIAFTECDGAEPAGPLKAEGESADSREEVKDIHHSVSAVVLPDFHLRHEQRIKRRLHRLEL